MADAVPESTNTIRRETKDGRTLFYKMTVIQQPDQARACGSGMKANSDRRPVDPPPVVELRILEGPTVEQAKDITFDYNAHFFLFASLETSRQIAQPRNTPASNPPILTGVPASAMAYLDRPHEAGYFIFPDLSVRHEGYYHLSFSLFETTKDKKDLDISDTSVEAGVDYRMEVRTKAFCVYSAKKFPGLKQSTNLSIAVAEQGCRVRIRRDVRMRKRDKREDERPRHRTVTPATEDPYMRNRSASNSSEHRVPYSGHSSRRPSLVGAQPHVGPPPPPTFESSAPVPESHLAFGDRPMQNYATPRSYGPVPQSPTGPYGPHGPHGPRAHVRAESYHSAAPPCPSPIRPGRLDAADRRYSNSYMPASPSADSMSDAHSRRDSYAGPPLVPHSPARCLPKLEAGAPPTSRIAIASLVTHDAPLEVQTDPIVPPPVIPTGGKRKMGDAFIEVSSRIKNGMRNPVATQDWNPRYGEYERADGRMETVAFYPFITEVSP
jgi:hypothetical protein